MSGQLGVAAKAIVRFGDSILMLRRSSSSTHDPGLWELPGGKLEFGEVLTDTLRREVLEETGLDIRVGQPLVTWHFAKEPFWVTGVTFVCECDAGEVVLSDEHDQVAWGLPEEHLGRPLSEAVEAQIRAYLALSRSRVG